MFLLSTTMQKKVGKRSREGLNSEMSRKRLRWAQAVTEWSVSFVLSKSVVLSHNGK